MWQIVVVAISACLATFLVANVVGEPHVEAAIALEDSSAAAPADAQADTRLRVFSGGANQDRKSTRLNSSHT